MVVDVQTLNASWCQHDSNADEANAPVLTCKTCPVHGSHETDTHFRAQQHKYGRRNGTAIMNEESNIEKCAYDACDRPAQVLGWCRGHYQQQHKGQELRPLKSRVLNTSSTHKFCPQCGKTKLRDEFYVRSNGVIQSACKLCMIEKAKVHQKAKYDAARAIRETLPKPTTKACTKCDAEKPMDDFYLKTGRKMSRCRECRRLDSLERNRARAAIIHKRNGTVQRRYRL